MLVPWIQSHAGGTPAAAQTTVAPSTSPAKADAQTTPAKASTAPSVSPSPSPAASVSPSPSSGKGVSYTIVKGDTLWDLSRQYYRDPFQYMKIANYPGNNINNPDLIFENQRIFIPDK
jgi:nucleoid-associated protein YgaU